MRLILSSIICFLVGIPVMNAQLFQQFLPGKCRATAETQAKGTNPGSQLIAIGTMKATIPLGFADVNVSYNLQTGKSESWFYVFRSDTSTSAILYLSNALVACFAVPLEDVGIPDEGLGTVELPGFFLEGETLMGHVSQDSNYQKYRTMYPDSLPSVVLLSTSPGAFLGFPPGTPYWIISFAPGRPPNQTSGMNCFVHAQTGETICVLTPTSVQQANGKGQVSIHPNPVDDVFTASIPDDIRSTLDGWWHITDVTGRRVKQGSWPLETSTMDIMVADLPAGVYSWHYLSGYTQFATPVFVQR